MVDTPNFQNEADRLNRKAEQTENPSETRMLQTYAKFYETLASEPAGDKAAEPPQDKESPGL